jgi:CAP12/Pycsar effector protein, TIR domain
LNLSKSAVAGQGNDGVGTGMPAGEGTMTAKTSTFAGQLKHFAQTVDIVDDSIFNQVRSLVCKYVTHELNSEYFELFKAEAEINGSRKYWLRTFWSSEERHHFWPIKASDGGYTNPVTAAFDNDRPMWLVSVENKEPLDGTGKYEDQWSNIPNLSRYQPASHEPIRTLIVLPLSFQKRIGVFCIESSDYIEVTDVAKAELCRLADALSLLYGLWDVNRVNSECKDHAIGDLRDLLDRARFPKLAKPHVFVAFSKKADETVTLAIKDVLGQFADKLEFTDWTRMEESGNITAQIGKEILESRFGICYFSEPAESTSALKYEYDDNRNVVFEAGMLHARTNANSDRDEEGPSGWIPIREQNSPPPPFDFAAERILYVPRAGNGELNESKLRTMLTKRILRLLGEG